MAFLYVEQSPLNLPKSMQGKIKRPDYIVGIPYAGSMAFDVKAKSTYDDCLLFEVGEVDKLARYSAHFHVSVYFACLDLDQPDHFHWVALRDLIGRAPERRGKARVLAIPTTEAFEVEFVYRSSMPTCASANIPSPSSTISCDLVSTCRAAGAQDMVTENVPALRAGWLSFQ